MINLTSSQLRRAADLKDQIVALEQQIADLLEGAVAAPVQAPAMIEAEEPSKPAKRTMSAAHKAKIRAAQALRWAKYNAAKEQRAAKPAKKGGMSAAGRASIIAAQKARWAKFKAAKAEAPAKQRKNKMSAAGRAAIAAAARARWARVRAGKK